MPWLQAFIDEYHVISFAPFVASETEDHIAYLFEVMRYLIAGDDVAVANLTQQQAFLAAHIQPWVGQLCDTLARHPKARFYPRAFISVEAQRFDMLA